MWSLMNRWLADRDGAYAGLALAFAALCAGCMTPASRMYVDEVAAWREAHADGLQAFLSAARDSHALAIHTHLRERLTVKKNELASALHRITLERVATCAASEGVASPQEREEIHGIRDAIAAEEAAGMSRLADVPRLYQLVQDLVLAELSLSEKVASRRRNCAGNVEKALNGALDGLSSELENILVDGEIEIAELPREWKACKDKVTAKLEWVEQHVDQLKKCKSLWHGDCKDPDMPLAPEGSPMVACLEIVTKTPAKVEQLIRGGEHCLDRRFRGAAEAIRGVGLYDFDQGGAAGGTNEAEAAPESADTSKRAVTDSGLGLCVLRVGDQGGG